MTFPVSINPDVQVIIDEAMTDRRVRAELTSILTPQLV